MTGTIGAAVSVEGRRGTVVDHHDSDTWPTLNGHYHPSHPGDRGYDLIRWDDWADDEWIRAGRIERHPDGPDTRPIWAPAVRGPEAGRTDPGLSDVRCTGRQAVSEHSHRPAGDPVPSS